MTVTPSLALLMENTAFVRGVARAILGSDDRVHDVVQDTFLLLTQLGHSEAEARRILDETLATKKRFKDVDALLHAVYEQSGKAG